MAQVRPNRWMKGREARAIGAVALAGLVLALAQCGPRWSLRPPKPSLSAKLVPQLRHSVILSGDFSPDGTRVVTASTDGTAAIWDVSTGILVHPPRDGSRAVTSSWDGTAVIWDVATGGQLRRLDGHARGVVATSTYSPERIRVSSAEFSVGGNRIVTASWDNTAGVWDAATGTLLHWLEGHDGDVMSAEFSSDGAHIVTVSRDGWVGVWDAATGKLRHRIDGHDSRVEVAKFSGDGQRVLTGSWDGTAAVWDAATGALIQRLRGKTPEVVSAVFSPDGLRLATASLDHVARIWDLRAGKLQHNLTGHDFWVTSAVFSPDGKLVVTASSDGTSALWDAATGKMLHRLRLGGASAPVGGLADFSPDGRLITTPSGAIWRTDSGALVYRADSVGSPVFSLDGRRFLAETSKGVLRVFETATGAVLSRIYGHRDSVDSMAFSPDGSRIATAGTDNTARVWDAGTGALLHRLDVPGEHPGEFVAFSPDGTRVVTSGGADDAAVIWDVATGAVVHRLSSPPRRMGSAGFSPDGARVLTMEYRATGVWDAVTGRLLHRLQGKAHPLAKAFSPGGQRIVTASRDGTTRIWRAEDGAYLAGLTVFEDGSWAVTDSEGRFDASGDGRIDGLAWVVDGLPYSLDQLRDQYYDPGLLAKVVGLSPEPLRRVPKLSDIRPPPRVYVDGPRPDGRLNLKLEDRGAGIGPVTVLLNGSDASSVVLNACPDLRKSGACSVDLSVAPTWVRGADNRVTAYAFDGNRVVQSRGVERVGAAGGSKLDDPPDLWVLAVGVSDYSGTAIDLRFSAADAAAFANALEMAGGQGFGPDRTHVRLLTTDSSSADRPSRETLAAGFSWLREGADPLDTVVVFLSGHGASYKDDEVDDYFYLLPSAQSVADIEKPDLRRLRTWSGRDLADALVDVPANKRVVILDTCAAAKADLPLATTKTLSSDAIRAHARARERTGAWFLAGAAADRPSYEASRFGQGVLTYALLEGMLGPALAEDQVLVSRLFKHAEDQVPIYARGIGGIQRPYFRRGANDFQLGEVPAGLKVKLPVGRARPVVVRTSIQFRARGRPGPDEHNVQAAVDRALRAIADGPSPPLVMFDTDRFPGGWQVIGEYSQQGSMFMFKGGIYRDDERGMKAIELGLKAANVDRLVAEIVEAVVAATPLRE